MDLPINVYVLEHLHMQDNGEESVKLIGIYSSNIAAEQAAERLKQRPGFRDSPEGFTIDLYRLDEDHWEEGFVTVKRGCPDSER